MAVATDFSVREYLEEAFTFLSEFSWIYNEKNVDIFVSHVLEKIPCEWASSLNNLGVRQLKSIPMGFIKEEWPPSLKEFVKKANDLGGLRYSWNLPEDCRFTSEDIEVPKYIAKSTPAKKLNEIKYMAAIVGHFAAEHNCRTIIDVGSGLGYLDQVLHHNFNLVTIGLESVKERSDEALLRIKNGVCSQNMCHVNICIENTYECDKFLRSIICDVTDIENECQCGKHKLPWDENSRKNVMMVGLHCCGNLMQDMMKLFCQITQLKLFLAAGCCFHKTPLEDFPVSSAAETVLTALSGTWKPCVTGLRLGCQMTKSNWCAMTSKSHMQQQECLFYRALFQSFLQKENLLWKKPKRHLRKHQDMKSFESFMCVAFQSYEWSDSEKEEYKEKFREMLGAKQHLFDLIKVLDLFQVLLQPIWEAVILIDRVAYFEQNCIKAEVFEMCDELVSPRNLLLFGIKNK